MSYLRHGLYGDNNIKIYHVHMHVNVAVKFEAISGVISV